MTCRIQLPGVELDGFFEIGDSQVELSALKSHESTIGQEGVAKSPVAITLECLLKIAFGCVEEFLRFSPGGDLGQLSEGESAQQIEPGKLWMALQTAV